MSAVINTDDRPDKSANHYPASNKKQPPKAKDKSRKKQEPTTSTLSLQQGKMRI